MVEHAGLFLFGSSYRVYAISMELPKAAIF